MTTLCDNDFRFIWRIHIIYDKRKRWQFWKRTRTLVLGRDYDINRMDDTAYISFKRGHMKTHARYSIEYLWDKDGMLKEPWFEMQGLLDWALETLENRYK